MSVRTNPLLIALLTGAQLFLASSVQAQEGPQVTQQTKAGLIRVDKDDGTSRFRIGNRLLYQYTDGTCSGIQWHGYSGSDELTLVYASSCANGEGIYPSWRLIVVKSDRSVVITPALTKLPDMTVSQLGERVTFG